MTEPSSQQSCVLIWPTASTVPLQLDKASHVIGWDSVQQEGTKQTTRITICAGVIPLECTIGNQTYAVQEDTVRRALEKWSDRYKCRRQNDSPSDRTKCPCVTCSCQGSLCIIGQWEPNNKKHDSMPKTSLPRLVPTALGPCWEKDAASFGPMQLLLYDSCKGLSHYRQDAVWSPKSLDLLWICGFQKTLVQTSEAQGLFHSFQTYLMSELPAPNDDILDVIKEKSRKEEFQKEGVRNSDSLGSLAEEPENRVEKRCNNAEPGAGDDNDTHLGERVKLFIAKHSLLSKHWGQKGDKTHTRDSFLRRFPIFHFFWMLSNLDNLDGTYHTAEQTNELYMPSELASKKVVELYQVLACCAVDSILGVVAGISVMYNVDPLLECLSEIWDTFHNRMLRDNIGWLETFPVGFKLNVPLTRNMGGEINMLVSAHDWIAREFLVDNAKRWLLILIGSFGVVFGFLAFLVLVFDLIRVATIHVTIFATCFKKIHRAQLYMLSSLWRLFRGKKRNILRHRTDTMEYDSIQLLLGVLLFAIALFLFTTVLVYYTFFTVLNLAIIAVMVAVWVLYISVRLFPLGKFVLRIRYPGWFTRDVYIEDLEDLMSGETDELNILIGPEALCGVPSEVLATGHCRSVTKLVAVPQSLAAIISEALMLPFVSLVSGIPSYIMEFIAGSPCTILQRCRESVDSIKRNRRSE